MLEVHKEAVCTCQQGCITCTHFSMLRQARGGEYPSLDQVRWAGGWKFSRVFSRNPRSGFRSTTGPQYPRLQCCRALSSTARSNRCYSSITWPKQAELAPNQLSQPEKLSLFVHRQRKAWSTHHFWYKVIDRYSTEQLHTLNDLTFQYLDGFHHSSFSVSLEKGPEESTHVWRRGKRTDTLGV